MVVKQAGLRNFHESQSGCRKGRSHCLLMLSFSAWLGVMYCFCSVWVVVLEQDKLLNNSPILCNGEAKRTKSIESVVTCQKADCSVESPTCELPT